MIVVVVVLPLTWRPISVDTDVDAYRRADSQTARNHLVPGSLVLDRDLMEKSPHGMEV